MLETTISNFIEQQFPTIYREEGPFFIEFLKQYYVWLETDPTSPIYQARHHVTNHDIDSTVDNFLIYFKEKYLKNIQINTATNTKQLIKNSIDLYRSKGTENAIKLFFDLIFSAESEVYYPGNDVFRLSNADWVIPRYLEVTSKPINRLLVGRAIVGVNSGAAAFVEKLVRRKIKNNYVEVVYVSAVSGDFETGETVKLSGDATTNIASFPLVLGSLTTLEVLDGGSGFSKGDVVKLESRTGGQGRGLVSDLQSITGIVDFTLIDGGWGYTVNTDIHVSEKVIVLSNAHVTSTTNNSLDGKILNIVQPMANVQWYNNTASFGVGNTVYNYYANGVLIGVNKILNAEYGTSNTTNFFLLNTISGNNYMDPTLRSYYTAGNTASFQVQVAGWANNTATGTAVGDISSNVTIYCTGNSQVFSVDDHAYQISNTNQVYANSRVKNITNTSANVFFMEVDGLEGMFLTNQSLKSELNGGNVAITSLSYGVGLRSITGSFNASPGNYLIDTANTSLWNASISQITFGSGANTGLDTDLLYPETIALNTTYVRDHIDELNSANWINATSYGSSLNTANLTNKTLDQALMFQTKTLGKLVRLKNENPGIGYSYAPFVEAIDPLVAPLAKMDFVIRYASTTGVFVIGEEITQAVNGAKGLVKFANTSEVHIRRLTFEDRWAAGNSANSYLMVGTSSGFSAYPTEVTYDIDGIAGADAKITTKVTSSNSAVASLIVTDSGFCFQDGNDVEFSSLDDSHSGRARASVVTTGRGSGFYNTTAGFLSTNKYLYDGDYYQDFSYEIKSPITVGRYSDMLKSVLHVSGTRVFSSIMKNNLVDANTTMVTSTVSQANTPPIASFDFVNGVYTRSDLGVCVLSDIGYDEPAFSTWNPAVVVPGVGATKTAVGNVYAENGLAFTPALLALLPNGFSVVLTYNTNNDLGAGIDPYVGNAFTILGINDVAYNYFGVAQYIMEPLRNAAFDRTRLTHYTPTVAQTTDSIQVPAIHPSGRLAARYNPLGGNLAICCNGGTVEERNGFGVLPAGFIAGFNFVADNIDSPSITTTVLRVDVYPVLTNAEMQQRST